MEDGMMDESDDRESDEAPPDEPMGSLPVSFNVPVPTIERIIGQIARQILRENYGKDRRAIEEHARKALDNLIGEIVSEKAHGIIEELLSKPMQPTDGFGNPIGQPTNLQGVLAQHVANWASTTVDREGRVVKNDGYFQSGSP